MLKMWANSAPVHHDSRGQNWRHFERISSENLSDFHGFFSCLHPGALSGRLIRRRRRVRESDDTDFLLMPGKPGPLRSPGDTIGSCTRTSRKFTAGSNQVILGQHIQKLYYQDQGLYNDQGPRGVKRIYRLTFAVLMRIPERTTTSKLISSSSMSKIFEVEMPTFPPEDICNYKFASGCILFFFFFFLKKHWFIVLACTVRHKYNNTSVASLCYVGPCYGIFYCPAVLICGRLSTGDPGGAWDSAGGEGWSIATP